MPRYRRRSPEVDAILYTGGNGGEAAGAFEGGRLSVSAGGNGLVFSHEVCGSMQISPGNYVSRNEDGAVCLMDPASFGKNREPVPGGEGA